MKVIAFLAYLVVRALTATLRVEHVRPENIDRTPRYILAFWHCQLLPLLGRARWTHPIAVMISQSKDGELIARVLAHYGVQSARGSTTRGGVRGLRELLREAQAGKSIVFAPDGPRGPARVVKEGLIYSAQISGLPIMPVAFAARKKKLLRSWDRMMIPLPFSKSVCVYGVPMIVPRDANADEWRMKVENTLNELSEEAERRMTER
jgi:lysophospholipid acyltransferase (LPLAT)-like uncharacterized protein